MSSVHTALITLSLVASWRICSQGWRPWVSWSLPSIVNASRAFRPLGLKVDLLECQFSGQMTAAQRVCPPLWGSPLFCVLACSHPPADRNVILAECGRAGREHHPWLHSGFCRPQLEFECSHGWPGALSPGSAKCFLQEISVFPAGWQMVPSRWTWGYERTRCFLSRPQSCSKTPHVLRTYKRYLAANQKRRVEANKKIKNKSRALAWTLLKLIRRLFTKGIK